MAIRAQYLAALARSEWLFTMPFPRETATQRVAGRP
jgi:hypothetical protein